jgi:hypothetical protein
LFLFLGSTWIEKQKQREEKKAAAAAAAGGSAAPVRDTAFAYDDTDDQTKYAGRSFILFLGMIAAGAVLVILVIVAIIGAFYAYNNKEVVLRWINKTFRPKGADLRR